MAIKIADVFVGARIDTDQYERDSARLRRETTALGNVLQGVFRGIGQRLFDGLVTGFNRAVNGIGRTINAASGLGESINKTSAVFGQSAQEILDWSQTTANALGQSQQQAVEAAATFGNLFVLLGFGRGEAAEFSQTLVELASDLASFNNIDPTEALEKLRAGLVGETEPLRTLGVNINAATVEAKAFELGIASAGDELTEQQKVIARYNLILDQTATAQGDFARTAESLPNALRRASAGFDNLRATIGSAFEPLASIVANTLADLANRVAPFAENIAAQIANGLAAGLRFITPVLQTMRDIFVFWLQPGSPPRLLPELVRWGQSAAQEYLSGWSQANFDALDRLGSGIERAIRSFVDVGQIDEIDVVGRVLGTREAITRAIGEFREVGRVSQETLSTIALRAGPAGDSVRGVVEAFFELESATRATEQAQSDLNAVNERFADIIDPLQDELGALREREKLLRNQQRIERLQETVRDPLSTGRERELAQLQIAQLELQNQITDANRERDEAVTEAEAKLEQAQEAEKAAAENLSVQESALDQQVRTNELLGEQVRLYERLEQAAQRAADAAAGEAQREAAKALQEAEQAAKAAAREQEQLAAAQLRYELQLADTPGKIAIMREELAKAEKGSVEYFNILVQIAQLEQRLAQERAQGGAGAGLPLPDILPPELFETEDLVSPELQTAIDGVNEAIAGIKEGLADGEAGEPPQFVRAIKEAFDTLIEDGRTFTGEIWPSLRTAFEEAIKLAGNLTVKVGELFSAFGDETNLTDLRELVEEVGRILDQLNELFGNSATENEEITRTAWQRIGTFLGENLNALLNLFTSILSLLRGDWEVAWENLKEAFNAFWGSIFERLGEAIPDFVKRFATGLFDTAEEFRGFVEDVGDIIGGLVTDMLQSGKDLIGNLFDGMKGAWEPVETWFRERIKWFKDQLPGSEPKDASSPLRGLSDAGAAIIGNIQQGIEAASLNVDVLGATAQAAAAGATTNNSTTFNIVVNATPGTDVDAVRAGVQQGVTDAMRARGG